MAFPYSLTVPLLKDVKSQMPQAICEMGPVGLNRNLLVNRDVPPFDNPDLRHAMALSLDRQAFIDILTEGQDDIGAGGALGDVNRAENLAHFGVGDVPASAAWLGKERAADPLMRWGLVPFWAKDIKVGFANINAKAEGIENKPAFREAFRQRRCLVPVDNFFEWKKVDGGKQPYAIGLKGGGLMALAGLWETWRAPSSGERVRSFAIVTTEPNELCAALHNRIPVVLAPAAWPAWLGQEPADEAQLKALLAPYPSDAMICWPVSARVGNVRNNDSSLIEPVGAA